MGPGSSEDYRTPALVSLEVAAREPPPLPPRTNVSGKRSEGQKDLARRVSRQGPLL